MRKRHFYTISEEDIKRAKSMPKGEIYEIPVVDGDDPDAGRTLVGVGDGANVSIPVPNAWSCPLDTEEDTLEGTARFKEIALSLFFDALINSLSKFQKSWKDMFVEGFNAGALDSRRPDKKDVDNDNVDFIVANRITLLQADIDAILSGYDAGLTRSKDVEKSWEKYCEEIGLDWDGDDDQ